MKEFNKMSLDSLYLELGVIDDLLAQKKQIRLKIIIEKESELIEKYNLQSQVELASILDDYKSRLTKELGIEDLRRERSLIKEAIEDKQKIEDSKEELAFS